MNSNQWAYDGFGGTVDKLLAQSTRWWPPRVNPPADAPNVVIVLCDDLGFADIGCYGSEIETPNVDRVAAAGVRFTNFHVTPLCSPTRAALLTGVNPHAAGVAAVGGDNGFPGYCGRISESVATAAEVFRANGYATFMAGKWHLNPVDDLGDASDKASWPLQRGFDRYYGFSDPAGFTNLHHPHRLQRDNSIVEVDAYPDGYFFTDDITDQAIGMVRSLKAGDPSKPFLLYLAHGAVHGPLQAKPADLAKYRGRYDIGWDRVRQARFARQLELGVIPKDTTLAPRNSEPWYSVKPWDELLPDEQTVLARHMEVYAGMVDNIDQNFGRLRMTLDELDELDNTIFIFMSDNGASREGGEYGTTEYMRTVGLVFSELENTTLTERDVARLDQLGGPRVLGHYPWGWAMAGNTPFRLYKSTAFNGGHQVPFVISWPATLTDHGSLRDQYTHVTDVVPTLIELIGLTPLVQRNGRPIRPMTGCGFGAVLRDPAAPTAHIEQYIEMNGHRAYYRDGWEAVTLHHRRTPYTDAEWQLYHSATDPTQLTDLAAEHPDRLAELRDAWDAAAWANQVYPLDDGTMAGALRPGGADPTRSVTLTPANHTLDPYRSRALIRGRAFSVTVRLAASPSDQGTLVAHGDQGGGYGLYLRDGHIVYVHNAYGEVTILDGGSIPDGTNEVVLNVAPPDPNIWTVSLTVNGEQRATLEHIAEIAMLAPFEGIDVGIDRRSPVWWDAYERWGPFPFIGTLHSVTYAAERRDAGLQPIAEYRD